MPKSLALHAFDAKAYPSRCWEPCERRYRKLRYPSAKDFNTAPSHIANLACASTLSSFNTYVSSVIRVNALSYSGIFRFIPSLVYSLKARIRSGFQAPFANVSLNLVLSSILVERPVIIGSKQHPMWANGDFQE
ncbi:hypothetical protein PHYSODRAFT_304146 [Phytophthora sojae]|uniref:Uncharacterized protein n=1 Tax=Phytophthora sojae (strain P6497) TaxID=1094619 RepID=G4ZXC0_PHYSP|nr:hypothetical protein PHYSODRAFT_304146 [Phytophthora sojae]EGZ12536.1 hypothetical protein PHYSODRAFT_304146 [Phytophthora sojae]|eukprot:XP_009532869.1 hypothetical protein PHYSODRAFT_304146 [Phytophthora sojae]